MRLKHRLLPAAVATAALLSACGSTDVADNLQPAAPGGAGATTAAPATTATPATTAAPATTDPAPPEPADEGITSFADAQPAVLYIDAKGSYRDVGQESWAGDWSGSGFFISPDGLAVTNNHVVTGAAQLEIFAGGDMTRSWNARIVGMSECNDLAVLQVDVGDEEVPYLEWHTDEVKPGLDIYLAGFPLGDPEYTLVRGIIAKAKAHGDRAWASIPHTVQYDAQSQSGNSGGPVVTADGKVVAVHYSSARLTSGTSQFFGIDGGLAKKVTDRLQQGTFESLGIGAEAFVSESGLAGVWVTGVTPGGLASDAGIQAGDVILSLNGFPVGLDGTMKDYCSILRTSGPDQPITVQVLRFDTGEVLTGEVNGDKELASVNALDGGEAASEQGSSYTYKYVSDDTGQLRVSVPEEWTERNTAALDDFAAVAVAPDLVGFDSFNGSGVLLALAPGADANDIIRALDSEMTCGTPGQPQPADTGFVFGTFVIYEGCPGGSVIVGGFNAANNPSMGILLLGVMQNAADVDAINQAVNSIVYAGE